MEKSKFDLFLENWWFNEELDLFKNDLLEMEG